MEEYDPTIRRWLAQAAAVSWRNVPYSIVGSSEWWCMFKKNSGFSLILKWRTCRSFHSWLINITVMQLLLCLYSRFSHVQASTSSNPSSIASTRFEMVNHMVWFLLVMFFSSSSSFASFLSLCLLSQKGTKLDLAEGAACQVRAEDALALASRWRCSFFQASAKTAQNVEVKITKKKQVQEARWEQEGKAEWKAKRRNQEKKEGARGWSKKYEWRARARESRGRSKKKQGTTQEETRGRSTKKKKKKKRTKVHLISKFSL